MIVSEELQQAREQVEKSCVELGEIHTTEKGRMLLEKAIQLVAVRSELLGLLFACEVLRDPRYGSHGAAPAVMMMRAMMEIDQRRNELLQKAGVTLDNISI